ncbi:MAG: hypothetical protein ABIP48_10250 [Planctomycetota bacterium]
MGETPEPGVGARAVVDQEPLHRLAQAGAEEDHCLADAIEGRFAGCGAFHVTPAVIGRFGFVDFVEQRHLFRLLLAAALAGGHRVVLAEKMLCAFGHRQQSGLVALHLDERIALLQMDAQSLGNLPRRVKLKDEG